MGNIFRYYIFLIACIVSVSSFAQTDCRDVDGNGSVDMSDVTKIIGLISSGSEYNATFDVNGDNTNDISDIADVINYILGVNSCNGYEYVDLGLSVKWATCNVGSTTPEGAGNYYAWGETYTKEAYSVATYSLYNGNSSSINKYCTKSEKGTVDNVTTLDLSDDAAHVNMGGKWRMPTNAETSELRSKCTWTKDSARNGYVVTGPNGNSIFIPCSGYMDGSTKCSSGTGYYWASSLNSSGPNTAYCMHAENSSFTICNLRSHGCSVRGVIE